MDPLIRSARLAAERTRLSQARTDATSNVGDSASAQAGLARERLRTEIERHVRAELGVQMEKALDAERERARIEGREAAAKEAKAAAVAELQRLREQLTANVDRAVAALEQAHRAAMAQLESSVGEVAFAAVCRLIGRELPTGAWVMDVVKNTCAQLRGETAAVARLHPRDIDILRDLLQGRELQLDALALKVVPDESLEIGGCRLESASGNYDGSLDSQLRRLHAVLTRADLHASLEKG